MADFTITITNSMVVIGPGEPNVWGTMQWGDNWGSDNDMITNVFKRLDSESVSLSQALFKQPGKFIDAGTMNGAITMGTACHFDGFGDFKYVRASDYGEDNFSKISDGSDGWNKTSDGTDNWGAV